MLFLRDNPEQTETCILINWSPRYQNNDIGVIVMDTKPFGIYDGEQ